MKTLDATTGLAVVLAALFLAIPAAAQDDCAEGRTSTGECVNVALAQSQRRTAIIYSQYKISETAYAILPVEDRDLRYPNGLIPDPSRPSGVGVPLVPVP